MAQGIMQVSGDPLALFIFTQPGDLLLSYVQLGFKVPCVLEHPQKEREDEQDN
ncbi:hypothetical protein D3C81_1545730 [compost metagenome]